jgi:dTDP-4-dehydrorhamnose 3,5-epimerase
VPDRLGIAGVRVVDLTTISDARGGFMEVFRQDWFPDVPPMVQCNLSRSRPGVLRGMHFHRRQADYWCVLEGRGLVALYDLRSGSPTEREGHQLEIDATREPRGIYIPPGVGHGFFAHSDLALQYLVDRAFDGTDEFGFAWNDPDLPIRWPAGDPILSERDSAAPALADVLLGAPVWRGGTG